MGEDRARPHERGQRDRTTIGESGRSGPEASTIAGVTSSPGRRGSGPSSGAVVARPGQIRRLGPVAALLLPATLVVLAGLLFYGYPCEGSACVRPTLTAYLLLLLAAPTSLLAGLPWFLHPLNLLAAGGTSLVLWLVLGRWAARRATDDVDATWGSYAGELAFMLAGVWGGIIVGLSIVGLWLSH